MEYGPLVTDAPFCDSSRGLSQNIDILQFTPEEGINAFQESVARPPSPSRLTGQTRDEDMDTAINESEEALIPLDLIEAVNWKLEVCSLLLPFSR